MSIETSPKETIAPSDVEYHDGMRDGVLLCASILANYRRETLEQTGATQITSFCEALELGLQQVADAIQSKLKSAALTGGKDE